MKNCFGQAYNTTFKKMMGQTATPSKNKVPEVIAKANVD